MWKKRFPRLLPGGFRDKLLLAFVFCSVIPILVVGMISYGQSFSIARQNILDSVRFSSGQISQTISHRLEQMETVSDTAQYQMYQLSNTPRMPFTGYLDRFIEVRGSITSQVHSTQLHSVNVFVDAGEVISKDGIMFAPFEALADYGLTEKDLTATGLSWRLFPDLEIKRVPYVPGYRSDVLACYRVKRNITTGEMEYVYFVTILCEEISALLEGPHRESGIERYLTDRSGTILAHPDRTLLGTALSEQITQRLPGASPGDFRAGDLHVSIDTISQPDWLLVTVVPDSYIRRNTMVLVSIILIALASVLAAVLAVITVLSRGMSKKLGLLSHTMRRYKTTNDTKGLSRIAHIQEIPEEHRDEFDELTLRFGDMARRIETDFQQIMEMKLQEEKLSYQLLQSKINPHFLYNILESVQACQALGKVDVAGQMVSKLAKFYRQQLGRSEDLIPIREELETGRTYLEIESLSRGDRLTWEIRTEEGIEDFLICRFSLQPILENCVVHGFRSGMPLHIAISAEYGGEQILIRVKDDGCGIPPDKLADLCRSLQDRVVDTERHFGIGNVAARLSMYGDSRDCPIVIDSGPGRGTTVTLRIEPTQ